MSTGRSSTSPPSRHSGSISPVTDPPRPGCFGITSRTSRPSTPGASRSPCSRRRAMRRRPRRRWPPAPRSRRWPRAPRAVVRRVASCWPRWPPSCPRARTCRRLPLNTVSDPIDDNGMYLLVEMTERTHTDFSAVKSLVSHVRPAGRRNQDAGGARRGATPFRHQRQPPVRRLGSRARARSWFRWPRRHPTCPTPRPTSRPRRRSSSSSAAASPFSG